MFLKNLKKHEDECEAQTLAYISSHSDLKEAFEGFNSLLQHLYLFSACHWGCHGKEHAFEYLAGKGVNSLAVVHIALLRGYYDEALSLVRTVGEIANLLNLFWMDNSQIRPWLDLDEGHRIHRFGPAKVRAALKKGGFLVPFSDAHYKLLCETATHPTPHSRPNAYSDKQKPVLGSVFQEPGFTFVFWNMVWALAVVSGPTAKLADFNLEQAKHMVSLTVPLFKNAIQNLPQLQC